MKRDHTFKHSEFLQHNLEFGLQIWKFGIFPSELSQISQAIFLKKQLYYLQNQ
jgi:hypothetical protein